MPEELVRSIFTWTAVLTFAVAGGLLAGGRGPLGLGAIQIVIPTLFLVALCLGLWAEMVSGRSYVFGLMDWDAVPQALQFSSLYVTCLWMGFWLVGRNGRINAGPMATRGITRWLEATPSTLLVASAVFAGLQLTDVGLSGFWRGEVPRGFGQFEDWQLSQHLASLGQIGQLLCVVLSGIVWARRPSRLLLIIPLAESVVWAARLSRGMFLPPLLFVFAAYLCGGKVKTWLWSVAALAAAGLGLAGIVRGRVETPGLYQVLAESYPDGTTEFVDAVVSASSVVGVLSVSVAARNEYLSPVVGLVEWLSTLLPLPTFLGWFDRTEVSLSHVLGIAEGVTGIPFPHLGELYYRMGWWGALAGVVVGAWFGFLQRRLNVALLRGRWDQGELVLWYIMSIYGMVLSFHSATRAATRPLLYALLLSLGFRMVRSLVSRRSFLDALSQKARP